MSDWVLTRKDSSESIALPEGMYWLDEFNWSKLAQTNPKYCRGGSQVIQQSEKLSGRPITLSCKEGMPMKRSDFVTLQKWSEVRKLKMTLARGNIVPPETYDVIFRLHDGAIPCEPLFFETPQDGSEYYEGEVRLIVI